MHNLILFISLLLNCTDPYCETFSKAHIASPTLNQLTIIHYPTVVMPEKFILSLMNESGISCICRERFQTLILTYVFLFYEDLRLLYILVAMVKVAPLKYNCK